MARLFNGTSDFIDCGTGAPDFAAVTFAAWIQPSSFLNTYNAPMSRIGGGNYVQVLTKSTGAMAWYTRAGGADVSKDPGLATLSAGTWYHVLLAYDSTNGLRTYVNGSNDGTTGASGSLNAISAAPMTFGKDTNTAGRFFAGAIAQPAVWTIALGASDIAALAGGSSPSSIQSGSLLSFWPFNGSSPEPDIIGGFNGTLNGTTFVADPPQLQPSSFVIGFASSEW